MPFLPPPRYTPYADPLLSRKPGTRPLDPAQWIEPGPDHAAQMREREGILAETPEAIAKLPVSEAAVAELGAVLRRTLAARPDYADLGEAIRRPDGATVALTGDVLADAGRLVQEDLCVLEKLSFDGEYVLTAAVLCFPSRWRLEDKIGRPLVAIHQGVPEYGENVRRRVNRIFDGLAPERPLWRANWLIHDIDALRQTEPPPPDAPPGSRLFVRVERQTLRRLPETRAVIFGIRTYIDPIEAVPAPAARALFEALESHSDEEIAYRGGIGAHACARKRLKALHDNFANQ